MTAMPSARTARRASAGAFWLVFTEPAWAHPDHLLDRSDFWDGLVHSLSGWDHLAVAGLIVWIASGRGPASFRLAPIIFLGFVAVGLLLAHNSWHVPGGGILAVAAPLLLLFSVLNRWRWSRGLMPVLFALTGLVQGHQHHIALEHDCLSHCAGYWLGAAFLIAAGTVTAGKLRRTAFKRDVRGMHST